MKLILREFWEEFSKLLNKNRWVKRITYVVAALFLVFLVKVIFFPSIEEGEVLKKGDASWQDIESLQNSNGQDLTETNVDLESMKAALSMFFVSANDGNVDIFTSFIDAEVLSNDFTTRYELEELFDKYDEAVARISRNGKIDSIQVVDGNKMLGKKTRVVIDIYYSDRSQPIRVSIVLQAQKDSHLVNDFEEGMSVDSEAIYTDSTQYVVTTSVWDLINEIERGAANEN